MYKEIATRLEKLQGTRLGIMKYASSNLVSSEFQRKQFSRQGMKLFSRWGRTTAGCREPWLICNQISRNLNSGWTDEPPCRHIYVTSTHWNDTITIILLTTVGRNNACALSFSTWLIESHFYSSFFIQYFPLTRYIRGKGPVSTFRKSPDIFQAPAASPELCILMSRQYTKQFLFLNLSVVIIRSIVSP
jgi:hypothetical protein